MRYLHKTVLLFLGLVLVTEAAAPISFCKCICKDSSTIIQLKGHKSDVSTKQDTDRQVKTGSCNDCNRQFCIDSNLPICKGIDEVDISTMCFQRDSIKDEAVVYLFILATVGLLVWAGIRPWVTAMFDRRQGQGMQYSPVAASAPR